MYEWFKGQLIIGLSIIVIGLIFGIYHIGNSNQELKDANLSLYKELISGHSCVSICTDMLEKFGC